MSKDIVIEQTLHGYSNGHHLLAASTELSKASQKMMLVLSDLSGNEIYPDFSEYLTGYPLPDDGYYALAKTWYASEKERPGCVWTHTLLIRFSDILNISDIMLLTKQFEKPQNDNYINKYNEAIRLYTDSYDHMSIVDHMRSEHFDNMMNIDRCRYMFSSIYSNDQPVLLPSNSSLQYENIFLLIWLNQWSGLRQNFAFCTGSLSNRKYGEKIFDLQVVPEDIVKSISRLIDRPVILDVNLMKYSDSTFSSSSPWIYHVIGDILHKQNRRFREFLEDFGATFEKREYFIKLAQLYVDTDAESGIKTIDSYFAAINAIFGKNDSNSITDNLLKNILNSISRESLTYNDNSSFLRKWFPHSNYLSFLQELSTTKHLDDVICDESRFEFKFDILWNSDNSFAKTLFRSLISKDLNRLGEFILKEYSRIIEPEHLPRLTDMDLGACHVLVSLNPELALCSEIWHQPRNFQCEIIDCIDKHALKNTLTQKIIETILEKSSEALPELIFKVFGERSISIFLDWCKKTNGYQENKIKAWMGICGYSPDTCILWLSSNEIIDVSLLVSIISTLDPYSEAVRRHGIKPWSRVFEKLDRGFLSERFKLTLAHFFLPLILTSNDVISKDFMEFSFYPIHEELAHSRFGYEQWSKLETLLPPASIFNAWDKCRRLRNAMKKRGFHLKNMDMND